MTIKNLKAGLYTVTFTNPDFETLSAEIEVKSIGVSCVKVTGGLCGSTTPPGVNITGMWAVFGTLVPKVVPPPPANGFLSVSSTPTAASVDVNGTDIGKTPVTRHELTIGAKLVTLRLSGYRPEERSITIVDGETASLDVALSAIPTEEEGFLSVTSVPSGASVSIGGVSVGTTPISAYGLPAGAKVVSISKAGYDTETRNVSIVAGETFDLNVALSEAVVPTTIGGWIDQVGVGSLTRDHWMYVYNLTIGASGAAAALYATLLPKPSEIVPLLVTRDNWMGLYNYTIGAMGAGNALTGCNY